MVKRCADCEEWLDETHFYVYKRNRGGLRNYCKTCSKKRSIRCANRSPDAIAGHAISYLLTNKKRAKHLPEGHLTRSELWALYKAQDGKCNITGIEFTTESEKRPSPDRIDSSKGYVPGNVHWVCARVNVMKMEKSIDNLHDWALAIVRGFNRDSPDVHTLLAEEVSEASWDGEDEGVQEDGSDSMSGES